MHMFGPFNEYTLMRQWRWSFHTSLVSDSHLFSAVSSGKYRNLNTLFPDSWFDSACRAHASVYGFWGKLHVFPT